MSDAQRPGDWDQPVSIPVVKTSFERILVPFDGSHTGERALGYAAALAEVSGGEIIVVVAYDPPLTVRRRGALTLDRLRLGMEEEAQELARESAGLLIERGLEARAVVVRGEVVDAILETIESDRADIVILGRRGVTHEIRAHGGRRETGQGAVADRVARHADVPVLLVG